MRKIYFLLITVFIASIANAQLIGSKSIPGDYATIAAAVTDLNTQGVGAGGVTFNVAGGYTESITAPIAITATGTLANPIVFQKSGGGANPLVTRTDAGSNATSTIGGLGDAVISLSGTDFITFDGIDVAAGNSGIEYGYYTSKPSATDGCKNVTIINATITMTKGTSAYVMGIYIGNGTTAVGNATGVAATTVAGANENITLQNNTVQNVHAGIYVRGATGYYDQNISVIGNTIQNFGGGNASTTYGVYYIYANNTNTSTNVINNAGGGGSAHGSTLYGVFVSTASGTLTANGNAITMANNSTSSATYYIYSGNTVTSEDISNNVFGAGTLSSTGSVYLIYSSNGTNNKTSNNNATTGTINRTGASGTFYGYYNLGSPTGGTAVITNNNFSNISLAGTTVFNGIYYYTSVSQLGKVNNNTVQNINIGTGTSFGIALNTVAAGSECNQNTVSDVSTGGAFTGIQFTAASNGLTAQGNKIFNLSSTGASLVTGLLHSAGTTSNIYKNKIYGLSVNNAGGTVYGVSIAGGTTVNLYNNLIGSLTAPISTNSADAIRGISITSATATTTLNISYNTVYLNASSSGANFSTSALFHTVNATATTATLVMRDNILYNSSTASGSGITSAYRRSGTALNNYGAASNNNAFYAGTPGTANVIFYDGTNSDQTLAAYKTRVASRDALSVTESVTFLSTTGSNAYYLHIDPTVATQLESGGTPIAGITDDFDGDSRNPNFPDIGADEFLGIPIDLMAPNITYTTLPNTLCNANVTLVATIIDASGINTSAGTKPRLYYKKSTDANTFAGNTSGDNGWKYVEASNASSPFSFTTNYALLQSAVSGGDVIQYFVVAQDLATTPNVGINSGNFATAPTSVALTATAFPITGAINSFNVLGGGVSGTVTIGAAGTYTSLTGAGGLFAAINASGLTGNVTANIIDASVTETGLNPLNPITYGCGGGTYTLTIKPGSGVTPTVTGSLASSALVRIFANNVIIDGSNNGTTSRDMTITNTNTTSPSVLLIGSLGANVITNVTAKNCIIVNGANTATALVVSDGTTSGSPGNFNNITIDNNDIRLAYIGLYCNANPVSGNGNGLTITNNLLNTSGANSIRLVGIYMQGVDGANITSNTIGNMANTVDASNETGIWLATGVVNTTVTNNTLSNISGTAGAPRGIAISSAGNNSGLVIKSNTFSGITTSSTGTVTAINLFSTTSGVEISANKITNIKNTNNGGYGSNGIWLQSTAANAATKVFNNFISDVASYGYTLSGPGDNGYGLIATAGAGYSIYYNSILLNNSQNVDGYPAAINITSGVSASGAIDLRNNLLINRQAVGVNRYAIYSSAANTVFSNIDNNDYYSAGPNLGNIGGTDRANIAAIQAGFGGNTKSISFNPSFASATDLHLTNANGDNWCLNGAGVAIAGVTTDIDGATREAAPKGPDMGADEFTPTGFTVTNPAAACPSNTVDLTAAAVTAGSMSGLTFTYFTDAAATLALATPNAVGTAGTYYIKASNGTCSLILPVVVSFNALPTPTLSGPASACQGSTGKVYTTQSGMTGYVWTVSAGGTITAGGTATDNTVTVTWNTTGAQTVSVNYTDGNGCTASTATVYNVTVNTLPTPTLSGPATPCAGSTGNVYTTESGMTGYVWTVSAGGTITAGGTATDNTVTVTWNTAGPQTVSVNYADGNGCSAASATVYNVTVNPKPTVNGTVTEATTCVSADGAINISVTGTPGPYTYSWTTIGGSGLNPGAQNQSGLTVGVYTVVVTDQTTNCSATASYTLLGPGGCAICPTVGSLVTNPSISACLNASVALNVSGLTAMGNTYGITFKYSTSLLTDPYSGGTVIATVANGALGSGGSTASTTTSFATSGLYYLYAILSPSPADPNCRPFAMAPLTVNDLPTITTGTNPVVCAGTTSALLPFTTTNISGSADGPLFVQYAAKASDVTSQNFETSLDAYDAEAGDDFNVPTGSTWNVNKVYVEGTHSIGSGIAASFNVKFYSNSAGMPGAAVATFNNVTTFVKSGDNYTITLPTSAVLAGGNTYWVEAQINMDYNPNGQWYWSYFGKNAIGNEFVWRNPGGAFGTSCTSFGYASTCLPTTGKNLIFTLTGNNGAISTPTYSIVWSAGALAQGFTNVTNATLPASPLSLAVPSGAAAGTYSGTITVTNAAGCTSTPAQNFTVTINPMPSVNTVSNQNVCNNTSTAAVTFSGPVAGTVYSWTNSTPSIGLAASGTGNIAAFTAVNATNAPVTATITVTPSYTSGGVTCTGSPKTFTITVNPTPNAVATPATQTKCSGTAITTIVLSGNVSGTTYNWTRDNNANVTGIAASGSGNISGTLVNTTNVAQTVIFTITPTANGCPGTPITATVIVNKAPTVTCPANVTVNSTTGLCGAVVTYPAATAVGAPTPTITYSQASGTFFPVGTTTVTVTATNSCGVNTCTFTVTVLDVEPPVITCPANITKNNDPNICGAVVTYSLPIASDNCAAGTPVTLQQTASQTPVAGSVSCNAGGIHDDNSYWRAYNLAPLNLTGPLTINNVQFGIEQATAGTGSSQPATIRLYTQTTGTFPGGTRTQVYSQNITIPNQSLTTMTVPLTTPPSVPANAVLIVELFTPAGGNNSFFVGSNTSAQTGPSYISATACGITTPTDLASIGFPNMHLILNVGGTVPGTITVTQIAGLPSGATFPVGTTTNTYKATDGAGNSSTCSFTVTVNDVQAPVITCPGNITATTPAGSCTAVVNYAVTATDNCPGVTTSLVSGLASG
ncbi:MAG: HYR domain-containing protein, partial [Bacteroidetes bacterium]|nr:HYR domain-containing protein [Bacteroidota bacterium]